METVTIKNTAPRLFNLPLLVLFKGGRGKPSQVLRPRAAAAAGCKESERFGDRRRLLPGKMLSVPRWYFDALYRLGGWKHRMSKDGVITGPRTGQREGNHLLNAVREKAKTAIADAREQTRQAAGEAADARARAAASAELAEHNATRIAELEAELAAANAGASTD